MSHSGNQWCNYTENAQCMANWSLILLRSSECHGIWGLAQRREGQMSASEGSCSQMLSFLLSWFKEEANNPSTSSEAPWASETSSRWCNLPRTHRECESWTTNLCAQEWKFLHFSIIQCLMWIFIILCGMLISDNLRFLPGIGLNPWRLCRAKWLGRERRG